MNYAKGVKKCIVKKLKIGKKPKQLLVRRMNCHQKETSGELLAQNRSVSITFPFFSL